MIRCISKYRDNNGVIKGYLLQDTVTNKQIQVSPLELKMKIQQGNVSVSNLKLTSDGRLIDYDDSKDRQTENRGKERIIKEYSTGNNQGKLNYALSKVNSKRVGKLVTRALLIGLTCVSIASVTTGCGTTQPLDVNAAGQVQMIETVQDKINMLNDASTIDIDVKNLSLTSKAVVSVEGQKIGTIEGKFIKIFDTLKFTDDNGNSIATGGQDAHLVFDGWTVYDSAGDAVYVMKEKLGITKRYIISDMEGNDVAWLKAEFWTLTKSANIYDMDDNVIAEINQSMFRKDFTIEVKDNSKIDNTSLTTISVNYMMQAIKDAKSSSKSNHNSSNSD